MSIAVKCSCGNKLRMSEDLARKKVRCPDCKSVLEVPSADTDDGDEVKSKPRPAAKARSRDRDEDEDGPRNKRKVVDEADDEEDEIPRRKKKGTNGGNKKLVWILFGGGAGLLLLIGAGVAIWLIFFRGGSSGPGKGVHTLGDQETYLPDGCDKIKSIRVAHVRSQSLWKDIDKDLTDSEKNELLHSNLAKKLGISEDDMERVTETWGTVQDRRHPITIVTTSKSLDVGAIAAKGKYTERKIGDFTLYEEGAGTKKGFAVPQSGVYLEGATAVIESVLQRNAKAQLSGSLSKAMELVDFNACGVDVSSGLSTDIVGGTLGKGDMVAEGAQWDLGSDNTVQRMYLLSDKSAAEQFEKALDRNRKKLDAELPNKDVKQSISRSGATVTDKTTVTGDEIRKRARDAKKTRNEHVILF
jgi:hypothetical protein